MGILFDLFDSDDDLEMPDGTRADCIHPDLIGENHPSLADEPKPPSRASKLAGIRHKYKPELNRKVYRTSDRSAVDGRAPKK